MTAWSSLTVLKLKEELAARSITFPSKAKKADLVALLEEFELAATKVKALFSKL
jgi:HeH/LEM domain